MRYRARANHSQIRAAGSGVRQNAAVVQGRRLVRAH